MWVLRFFDLCLPLGQAWLPKVKFSLLILLDTIGYTKVKRARAKSTPLPLTLRRVLFQLCLLTRFLDTTALGRLPTIAVLACFYKCARSSSMPFVGPKQGLLFACFGGTAPPLRDLLGVLLVLAPWNRRHCVSETGVQERDG